MMEQEWREIRKPREDEVRSKAGLVRDYLSGMLATDDLINPSRANCLSESAQVN